MSKLEIDFKFYSEYHSHKLNKIIHIFCIPLICFSLFIFLNYIPYSVQIYNTENAVLNVILNLKSSFILSLFGLTVSIFRILENVAPPTFT